MSPSTKEHCYADLKLRILCMDLKPGAVLDEAPLAAHYGLSRTPLREILRRMAGEGYVAVSQNRGAKVTSMDIATMRVFFQTAPMIYAHISRLAAENRTSMQMEQLKSAQLAFKDHTKHRNVADAALANHRFHAIIGDMAANPYLGASLDRLLIDHTRLSNTFYHPSSSDDATLVDKASRQHDALIDAIEAHESDQAVDLTLQHWDLSRDQMERYVHPDPLPLEITPQKETQNAI